MSRCRARRADIGVQPAILDSEIGDNNKPGHQDGKDGNAVLIGTVAAALAAVSRGFRIRRDSHVLQVLLVRHALHVITGRDIGVARGDDGRHAVAVRFACHRSQRCRRNSNG